MSRDMGRDRTQEVVGSSPISSTIRNAKSLVSPQVSKRAVWPPSVHFSRCVAGSAGRAPKP